MKGVLILVATKEEYQKANKYLDKSFAIFFTGVGSTNVVSALSSLDYMLRRDLTIINVGYAGSNCLPAGTIVKVRKSYDYNHPKHVEIQCKYNGYELSDDGIDCYTSKDFVTETDISAPVVFDMELNTICAFNFNHLSSYKIVSDNLSVSEYETFDDEKSWLELNELIKKEIL